MKKPDRILSKLCCVGEPLLPDSRVALQHRPEVEALVQWMTKKEIRSYLELGFYRGGLLTTLEEIFRFSKVAGCSMPLMGERMIVPDHALICWNKTESPEYRRFRHGLGKMELVFIDADHSYGAVRSDYEREKKQPHRFLAFHDIKNTEKAPGVVRLWHELGGKKRELFFPRTDGPSMGIGIWSQKETP